MQFGDCKGTWSRQETVRYRSLKDGVVYRLWRQCIGQDVLGFDDSIEKRKEGVRVVQRDSFPVGRVRVINKSVDGTGMQVLQ